MMGVFIIWGNWLMTAISKTSLCMLLIKAVLLYAEIARLC